jgi:hypothetical protein
MTMIRRVVVSMLVRTSGICACPAAMVAAWRARYNGWCGQIAWRLPGRRQRLPAVNMAINSRMDDAPSCPRLSNASASNMMPYAHPPAIPLVLSYRLARTLVGHSVQAGTVPMRAMLSPA